MLQNIYELDYQGVSMYCILRPSMSLLSAICLRKIFHVDGWMAFMIPRFSESFVGRRSLRIRIRYRKQGHATRDY